jgi:hypothetical protein
MTIDRTAKILLALIAVALWTLVLKPVATPEVGHAAQRRYRSSRSRASTPKPAQPAKPEAAKPEAGGEPKPEKTVAGAAPHYYVSPDISGVFVFEDGKIYRFNADLGRPVTMGLWR